MSDKKIIACWYEAGDCGTWLTWFINQHAGFSLRNQQITTRYSKECYGNGIENLVTDYGLPNCSWYSIRDIQTNTVTESPLNWREFVSANNLKGDICYKSMPYHNPLNLSDSEIEDTTITVQELAEFILSESSTSYIVYPIISEQHLDIFAKRYAFIRPQYTTAHAAGLYQARVHTDYSKYTEKFNKLCSTVTIDVGKLIIDSDGDTYCKLTTELNLHPINNWKSLVKEYYDSIFEPLQHISNEMLDNRSNMDN